MADRETLDAIGLRHGTDKASRAHDYLRTYDAFLAPLRDHPVSLLEIGVLGGASLRTWRDYFPLGRIIGVDIDPKAAAQAGERIEVHFGDQSDADGMSALGERLGPFDVVVDDGSHIWAHQISTLRALLPHVRPGGFFILEDLHTSHGRWAPKYRGAGGETATAYCRRVAERVLAPGATEEAIEDAFLRDAPKQIETVTLSRHAAIFRRKAR
ncbi:class I SAM-dependent methyltransferase [Muricoccus radiodurans]|uniref:class I SAM-dependent methyltransferase n=1 Tax=Muricoccus radiodurans TaxID=2231721 RepID=UPI003CF4A6E4